jgi:peptide/nickel transport system substrate-binding protein
MSALIRERNTDRGRVVRVSFGLLLVAVLLAACSSPGPAASTPQGSSPPAASAPASSGPKTLQLGYRDDPPTIHGGSSSSPERDIGELLNAGLTTFDAVGNVVTKLAAKVPSVADGDWKVSPDGSMEITWKLKPGLKWHDGAAFTAEDLAFSIKLFKDPEWPGTIPSGVVPIAEATATDAQTLVIRYARTNNQATVAGSTELPPVPRHLLEPVYASGGASAASNSELFTTQWVGMGPYRMISRTLGSQIEAAAFDDYVLGRPKIDRLIIKATNDSNALVARLFSGDVDMVPNQMEAAQAATLKQQWESAGRGTVSPMATRVRQVQLNFRDPAAPWAGDVRVRQAMLHLVDRQGLVDAVMSGLSPVAHTALLPTDPAYAQLEQRGLPRFSLDRAQGERLLDAAGWPRGADGIRSNAAGTVFRFNPANAVAGGDSGDEETLVLVDGFRAGGIQSEPDFIIETAADASERRAKSNGISRPSVPDNTYWDRFLSSQISAESNRWRLANTGGYSNPEVDRLIDQWRATLDPSQLVGRTAELHKLLLDELPALPLYYQVEVFAFRKGLNGPGTFSPRGRNATVDIHTWTLD